MAGFKMQTHTHLIDLYADDITLYLGHSQNKIETENNIKNTLEIFAQFHSISGLKLNLDKTSIGWFGQNPNQQKLCPELKLTWVKEFRLLGLDLDMNLENLNINYENGIEAIKKLLNKWSYKFLTPYGRITIIKTLALPKITHIATAIPNLDTKLIDDIQKLLFDFLWKKTPNNNASYKVAKNDSMIPQRLGGMGMLN